MELQHFSHEHPLILKEEEELCDEGENPLVLKKKQGFCDDNGYFHRCNGCSEPIFSTPLYSCSRQCNFYLHKSCVELPQVHIKHPLHPDHPLILLFKPSYPQGYCYCNYCGSKWEDFTYHCPPCEFDLNLFCASLTDHKFEHPSHKHLLTRMQRPILSLCDGCGTEHIGIFYACNSCRKSFMIHQDCASLPITFNHTDHHEHPLTLAYSIPSMYSVFSNYCEICTKKVEDEHALYYCGDCRYFVHVYCATSKYESFMSILIPRSKAKAKVTVEDPGPGVVQLPVPDETVSLISHFGQDTRLREREGSTLVGDQLIHFSHNHPLILSNYEQGDDLHHHHELCDACIKPITTAPFYRCIDGEECKFSLHKFCAELPTKVQHPGHPQHRLTLFPRYPKHLGVFLCRACYLYCNGFTYSCINCEYYVDVQCGFQPMSIKHEAHKEHVLSRKTSLSMRCSASGLGISDLRRLYFHHDLGAYRCDESCNFELLPFYIQLPHEIRHRYDKLHPFILTYSPVKGTQHWGEYICDICEKELNPKEWYYHCVECDQSLHVKCTPQFDRWSRLKFGGTHTIDRHPHPLTFVPVIPPNTWFHKFRHVITIGTKCNTIGHCAHHDRFCFYALKCLECKFKLHDLCAQQNKEYVTKKKSKIKTMIHILSSENN